MLLRYFRERFPFALFVPLAAVIAAVVRMGIDSWASFAADAGFAVLLLAQFRLWDDLADRERDRLPHPNRVLVRTDAVTQAVAFCGALGVLNICLAVWRDSSGISVSVLTAINAALAIWYLARSSRTAAGEHLLLAKYPAIVIVVAGARILVAPVQVLGFAAVLYVCVCAYEAWHDPAGPLARRARLSPGGQS